MTNVRKAKSSVSSTPRIISYDLRSTCSDWPLPILARTKRCSEFLTVKYQQEHIYYPAVFFIYLFFFLKYKKCISCYQFAFVNELFFVIQPSSSPPRGGGGWGRKGVLIQILFRGVPPRSSHSDPISDPKGRFSIS